MQLSGWMLMEAAHTVGGAPDRRLTDADRSDVASAGGALVELLRQVHGEFGAGGGDDVVGA